MLIEAVSSLTYNVWCHGRLCGNLERGNRGALSCHGDSEDITCRSTYKSGDTVGSFSLIQFCNTVPY